MATKGFDISVLGDRRLSKDFERLGEDMGRVIADRALEDGGKVIFAAVRGLVRVRTGRLRKGLKLKLIRTRRVTGWRIETPTRRALRIPASAKHYYPAALEYGHGNVPAHSFMRAGFDNAEERAFAVVRVSFNREIDRAVGRLRRRAAA